MTCLPFFVALSDTHCGPTCYEYTIDPSLFNLTYKAAG